MLLDCARDADARDLPLEFVVVGHTIDDRALLATGRVFVTGPYAADEAVALIKAQQASLALLPSVFPETWCLRSERPGRQGCAWSHSIWVPRRSGFAAQVAAFCYHLGLFPAQINNAIVAEAGSTRHELQLSG